MKFALPGYGFGFKRVEVFSRLLEECQEVLDVKNPDARSWEERRTGWSASSFNKLVTCLFEFGDVLLELRCVFNQFQSVNKNSQCYAKWQR